MKRNYSRKGSALLIVLGMLSFMVVSAVGFSIFMRESRKPSSHLKRSITARFLLRAALANAISRVDGELVDFVTKDSRGRPEHEFRVEGIFDDFYPGVGPSQNAPGENSGLHDKNGDFWDKRVFTPFGQVDPEQTVSTLTLESLAYLPPAIINEVRVWSRLTRTAEWKNLAYDLGRYAFCAVDVSDCFDVNKVRADERRSSAANHRVNFSPLYTDESYAQKLDVILDKVTKMDPASYISLADFNVVAGKGSPFAPWTSFIGEKDKQIYSSNSRTEGPACVSNALFITDTWFPPTNTVRGAKAAKTYNLEEAGGRNQPWKEGQFNCKSYDYDNGGPIAAREKSYIGEALYGMLQGIGFACLYDYLDEDQVPLSYCLPCTETAPMVCALGVNPERTSVKMLYEEKEIVTKANFGKPDDKTGEYPYEVTVTCCSLKVDASELAIDGVLAFPFKRTANKGYPQSFSGDALVRVFFSPKATRSRLNAAGGRGGGLVHPLPGQQWSEESKDGAWNRGVFTEYVPKIGISTQDLLTKPIKKQEDALGGFMALANVSGDLTLFYRVEKTAKKPGGKSETWYSFDGMKDAADTFYPRDEEGAIYDWWTAYLEDKDNKKDKPTAPPGGYYGDDPAALPSGSGRNSLHDLEVYPHVAVWVRLYNGDDTYDIVPARLNDDEVYANRICPDSGEWVTCAGGNDKAPILAFRDGTKISLDESTLKNKDNFPDDGKKLTFNAEWNRLYVADPRYNYAPENWFAVSSDDDIKEDWLDVVSLLFGKNGRDRDIFMFTSDQEYLQTIGELAFLPRVGEPNRPAGRLTRYYRDNSHFDPDDKLFGAPFASRKLGSDVETALSQLCQAEFFWRTYTGYDNGYDSDRDSRVYTLYEDESPCEIVSGVNDFRANPFSQDERIMAAVVMDTPFDYFAASTHDLNSLYGGAADDVPPSKAKYVFSDPDASNNNQGNGKDSAGYVRGFSRLADGMRQKFADGAKKSSAAAASWFDIYDSADFGWWNKNETGDDQVHLFGVKLDEDNPLHGVDRKFLYAFWRECFQNRQQLFLIFIRAEPLTVGGMGFSSLAASQLGARGVALVWRDPEPPSARGVRKRIDRSSQSVQLSTWKTMLHDSGPHRTRVLFYHPID